MLCAFLFVGCSTPVDEGLGQLSADPVLDRTIRNVEVELALEFWLDPETVRERLPSGVRLRTVEDYGIPESEIGGDRRHWVDTSLVLMSAEIETEGRPGLSGADRVEAFWWLQVAEGLDLRDERTRGPNQALELGYWVGAAEGVERFRAAGLEVGLAAARLTPHAGGWDFSFDDDDTQVRGRCVLEGEVTVEDYALPAFMTVWQASPQPRWFTVYTFAGHRTQRCRVVDFEVQGTSLLARSLRAGHELQNIYGVAQTGWYANAGIYRRSP